MKTPDTVLIATPMFGALGGLVRNQVFLEDEFRSLTGKPIWLTA